MKEQRGTFLQGEEFDLLFNLYFTAILYLLSHNSTVLSKHRITAVYQTKKLIYVTSRIQQFILSNLLQNTQIFHNHYLKTNSNFFPIYKLYHS